MGQAFEEELKQAHKESHFRSGHVFRELPFEEKQKIIRLIFGGKDMSGKWYGIYVKKLTDAKPKKYHFIAYGKLGTLTGQVKGNESDAYDSEIWDKDFEQYYDEIKNVIDKKMIKEHMLGKGKICGRKIRSLYTDS